MINATLLGNPEPNSTIWYGIRRKGITATDLPKILGLSQYGNARSVWHDKRGELPADDLSEAGQWGNLLEDVVAQEWARRNNQPVSRVGVLANTDARWMIASCDRLQDGRNAALEVKTRSAYVAGKWKDDIPDDVLAQVAWQRVVGKFDYVDVAVLMGGQELKSFRYEQDSQLENYIAEAAARVWVAVETGEPPPVNMDSVLVDLLDKLYPDRSGIVEVSADVARFLFERYEQASRLVRDAEWRKEEIRARIISTLDAAEVLTVKGETDPVFTYRAQSKSTISLKDLEDNDVQLYEELLAGGHITTTTSRVLRAGKGAKDV